MTSGFRIDSDGMNDDTLRHDGAYIFAGFGDTFRIPTYAPPYTLFGVTRTDASAFHLSGQWAHNFSSNSIFEGRAFYSFSDYTDVRLSEQRHIVDVDIQHTWSMSPNHSFLWGGGARYSWDTLTNGPSIGFLDTNETTSLYNAFAQITLELLDHRLIVTAGTKIEYNDYTGAEVQPTFRALYRVTERHKIWGAISRATRTPSRAENGILINAGVLPATISPPTPLTEIRVLGNSLLGAESLVAIEGGYRGQLMDSLTFDLTAYHHDYDDIIAAEQGVPFFETLPVPRAIVPQLLVNSGGGKTWGVEGAVNWQPTADLRLELTYSYVDTSIRNLTGSEAQTSPYHQLATRILYQITPDVGLNVIGRYTGSTPSSGLGNYFDLDAASGGASMNSSKLGLSAAICLVGKEMNLRRTSYLRGGATRSQPNAALTAKWRN